MSDRPNDQPLRELFNALANALLSRVQSGEAKPQDLAVAAKFLKDNGITCTPDASPNLSKLNEIMTNAFSGPDDIDSLLQ